MSFSLGKLVMTKGIADKRENDLRFACEVDVALRKYIRCDWGDTSNEGVKLNDEAVKNGDDGILATYNTSQGKIWILTEWDRSVTTILFPDEY